MSKPWVEFGIHLLEFGEITEQRPERILTRAGQTITTISMQHVIPLVKNGLDRLPWFRNLLEHGASAGLTSEGWMIGGQ